MPDSNQGQEQIRLWDFPSRRVLNQNILPIANIVFADSMSANLYNANALRVNMCADFAKLKVFACMGACIAVPQSDSELEYEDPLAGKIHVIHQRTFRMPMTQSANKYVRQLKNTNGQVFISEAGTCLAKSMLVRNVAKHETARNCGTWLLTVLARTLGSGMPNRQGRIFVASTRSLT